jgi:hypothetical protein
MLILALGSAFGQARKDSSARTADGKPDLTGVWNNASLTPLERPASLGDKQFFTEQEAAQFAAARLKDVNRDRRDGSNQADLDRAYNEAFFDRGTRVSRTMRTSLIVDPPNGKVPPLLPEASKKWQQTQAYFTLHPADSARKAASRPLPDVLSGWSADVSRKL